MNTTAAAFRLSPQQEQVWPLLESGGVHFRLLCAVVLDGSISPQSLRQALEASVDRHEILRTVFQRQAGMKFPFQVILDRCHPAWQETDLASLPPGPQSAELDRIFEQEKRAAADPTQGSPLKARLVGLSPDRHVLVLSLSPLCGDSATLRNLLVEISTRLRGNDSSAEIMQYADVTEWQYGLLEATGEEAEEGRDFWERHASAGPSPLILPFERGTSSSFEPGWHPVAVGSGIGNLLAPLALRLRVTEADLLLAGWQTLLWRLSGHDFPVVHTAFAGRDYDEVKEAMGLFCRYLPLRARFDGRFRFSEIVQQMALARTEAAEWQEYFLPGPAPADGIAFEYDDWSEASTAEMRLERSWMCASAHRMKLVCARADGSLRIGLLYNTHCFGASAVDNLARCFETLLPAAIDTPDVLAGELPLLSQEDRKRILSDWNATAHAYSREQSIHGLFEQQAARNPERPALVADGQQLTYAELNQRANRLAHHLSQLGVKTGDMVALCLDRSAGLMVSLMAALKAGAAYVPLNPEHPPARLAQQLGGAKVLITRQSLKTRIPAGFDGQTVVLENESSWDTQPVSDPQAGAIPEDLVYVIYTSGSTGTPRGVAVRHRNLVNYAEHICGLLRLSQESGGLSFAAVSTIAADLGNTCIFPSLISGGCLHLISQEVAMDARRLADYQRRHAIDVLKIVPSHLAALLSSEDAADILPGRYLITGGEALSWKLAERIRSLTPGCKLINHYGPTETTVGSLTFSVSELRDSASRESVTVPLGRPIANTHAYILDRNLQPVPPGVTGELYIGGAGVTRGYLNQPELTAERFMADPFAADPEDRLYRTGDLARYLPDGNIEFLGRADDQVKVRGFRIELGEIESVLSQHSGIRHAIVMARESESGDKQLAAWIVPSREKPSMDEIRKHLREHLPEYMLPGSIVFLEKLPLGPNGKIDRNALPAPDQAQQEAAYVGPRTPMEELVAGIWGEVLRRERVGVFDNFFEIGGHSLLATQTVSRIRRSLTIDLPLRSLFEFPTLAAFAQEIERRRTSTGIETPPIVSVPRDQALPLSFPQQRLWVLDQFDPGNPLYNVPRFIRVTGALKSEAVRLALTEIVRRHETLRTTFGVLDGQPVQRIAPPAPLPFEVIDLTSLSPDLREPEARRLAAEEARRAFDLAQGPLFRASLVRLDEDDHILLLNMHHIVSDAWSAGVFFGEFTVLYRDFSVGDAPSLPELPIQYADYAVWQRQRLQGAVLEDHLAYWRRQLHGIPPVLELPVDRPRPDVQSFAGAVEIIPLPVELCVAARALARREGVTLFMLLLAGFQALLSRYSGQDQIVVGTDLANRPTLETERIIGFFINVLPLRTDLSGNPSFGEILARVRETALSGYAHQELPLDKLVEDLRIERSLSHNPLVQALFVMQNTPRGSTNLAGLTLRPFLTPIVHSKFDLAAFMLEDGNSITGQWVYSTVLFDRSTIVRLAAHYENLLRHAVANPELRLNELEFLTGEEKEQRSSEEKRRRESQQKRLIAAVPKTVTLDGN